MRSFALERWDGGRVVINREFAPLFAAANLTNFDAIWHATGTAEAAKALRQDRITRRFEIPGPDGCPQTFYIKRHQGAGWREYLQPILHGGWPSVGATPEWRALLGFHETGLPTMVPVALGRAAGASFLITAALEDCDKLSELASGVTAEQGQRLRKQVADLARLMHRSGWHHQDFYLGHLLQPRRSQETVYVIDLGRVQRHNALTASRWIVKDLAQLNYSAKTVRATERLRFLVDYLGRPLEARDRGLIRRILRKTERIARHSSKNRL